ncbi:MAG: formylglycine-generating enzyme family protein [Myxococcales bacterium]|nr:formylglycine-generating enzyme family protein [Myxococcales bacterium]
MFSGDALSSWLLLFVGSGAACALAAVYRLLWRHRYRPLDAIGRRTFRVVGRVVSLPEESRDGDDPASDGERCIEIEIGERRHLVMTAGALIDVRARFRAGKARLELREGDLITVDGTLGQRRHGETHYRQAGAESVIEAVRIIGGSWPELRWLVTPVIAVTALLAAVSLTQLLGLGQAPRADEQSVTVLVGDPLYSYADDDGSWVVLPPGRMLVGPIADRCAADGEQMRYVRLQHTFEIGRTEVTRHQFERLMGYQPSRARDCKRDDCPVESVTWHEAAAYANALSYRRGLAPCYVCRGAGRDVRCMAAPVPRAPYSPAPQSDDDGAATSEPDGDPIYRCGGYRLPSEDEWEYAARAGSRDALPSGPLPNCDSASWKLSHVAWFRANSGRRPHAVAKRRPNRWRLYDIAGNVAEWTHERAVRGGSWGSPARDVRYSARSEHAGTYASPRIGLRVVRSL